MVNALTEGKAIMQVRSIYYQERERNAKTWYNKILVPKCINYNRELDPGIGCKIKKFYSFVLLDGDYSD